MLLLSRKNKSTSVSKVADVFRRSSVLIESPSGRSRPSDKGGGDGGGHPDPEIRGAGEAQKKVFDPSGLILV